MCLAVPAEVIEIDGPSATVDIQGVRTQADISLLDDVRVGDYVMVHTGFAIQKYDEEEAVETLRILKEISERAELQ